MLLHLPYITSWGSFSRVWPHPSHAITHRPIEVTLHQSHSMLLHLPPHHILGFLLLGLATPITCHHSPGVTLHQPHSMLLNLPPHHILGFLLLGLATPITCHHSPSDRRDIAPITFNAPSHFTSSHPGLPSPGSSHTHHMPSLTVR